MLQSVEQPETRAGGFGERLRYEREIRGISLDEISQATKIGTRLLRAIEKEDLAQLPGGIFNKGYIRAYAKYVGIDEEQAIADYRNAVPEADLNAGLVARQSHRAKSSGGGVSRRRRGFSLLSLLITVVVLAGAAGGWRLYRERQHAHRPARTVVASQAAAQHKEAERAAQSPGRVELVPDANAAQPAASTR